MVHSNMFGAVAGDMADRCLTMRCGVNCKHGDCVSNMDGALSEPARDISGYVIPEELTLASASGNARPAMETLFNRSAHSAGPEFRVWSSELGVAGPRGCPQIVYMLQINAGWAPSGAQIS